jgi:hypothetical protein
MKIAHLLDLTLALSNEEHQFVESNGNKFKISALSEKERVVARNLVRKGVYEISKDNQTLIKKINEENS